MRIVLLAHPNFMSSQSMPRFAAMLQHSYEAQGHTVQVWRPPARLRARLSSGPLAKWAGYVDQYLLFPFWLRRAVRQQPEDTLFVLTDQAQGPWVPALLSRPLVVHVHDLLALRSALGQVPENPTRWSGRIYQRYIRRGFEKANHFICISKRTQDDLVALSRVERQATRVVYNGLNQPLSPMKPERAHALLQAARIDAPPTGWLLHLSGNQWYKNVPGVIRLYAHYARGTAEPLPLWLIGVKPDAAVREAMDELPMAAEVRFLYGLDSEVLQAVYSLARAFLFPSHAEGFGWPIVEAQACACPVITTDDAPMNEIGGPASVYLPRLHIGDDVQAWAADGARQLKALLNESPPDAQRRRQVCLSWAGQFTADRAIAQYLHIYEATLRGQLAQAIPPTPSPAS